jgi:hypothetical protein
MWSLRTEETPSPGAMIASSLAAADVSPVFIGSGRAFAGLIK